ncbi:hypothetical protein D187_008917 [Cystobacter fuscus DSM 2262]|uniref:Cytochrome c domain-containing protein n=1 Tax=Cystobacter fuscus (strain ATCC 25194 / DSM 2262 / NBRC 100088 / M29) TaxID=1242864 RepID=S9QN77_CYSF2|nr:hypothetical protein [Cystobacter fuscus]EPX62729.1 hypothetical protein D187_008917 [Cystobacter fuscus DSM 2262]
MFRRFILGAALCLSGEALAKPPAGSVFCTTYPSAPVCTGQQPSCTYCHVAPPQRNAFGAGLESYLAPGAPRPLSDNDFAYALPTALRAAEAADADGDGVPNLVEIQRGTLPADANSVPVDTGGCAAGTNPQYDVCRYDTRFAYRRVLLDFCGQSPTYAQLEEFAALNADDQRARLDAELDRCARSEFWRGKNGQLWKLAHPKIRPVGSLKFGEDQGTIPLADYYDDYALYAYSQLDDHDARDVMTAKYFVHRESNPTRYSIATKPNSMLYVQDEKYRAGNITSSWSLIHFVMFTALPRNAASQAYRAYLGYDIARQEGLYSIPNEPRDYDAKGVAEPACAACHATLDPLSYPFRNYQGLSLTDVPSSANYISNRLETYFGDVAPTITQTPEAGYIFGQPVNNLVEWAHVGANSDAFAIATLTDYWKLLIGHAPTAEEHAEFVAIWQRFKGTHQYRVQRMLHDLIRTEAYGAP